MMLEFIKSIFKIIFVLMFIIGIICFIVGCAIIGAVAMYLIFAHALGI